MSTFTPKNSYDIHVDEEFGITEAVATLDNGDFGSRTIRFETGQLARQADGSVTTYLDDDTMMLATTTASNQPREGFDFFPLTVDVEERMYAAGRIPGSFFRREGRPTTQAILACRLIDRPLRPTFAKGLRNEVQCVITVMSMAPDEYYDVVAINGASAATQLSGLPVSGAVGGVRMALIADDKHPEGQWVAFPNAAQHERALFEMVVAGRMVERKRGKKTEEDVAIMMVEAGAGVNVVQLVKDGYPAPKESTVAEGLEAAKPYIQTLAKAQADLAQEVGKETKEFPLFPPYTDKVYEQVEKKAAKKLAKIMTIKSKAEREDASNEYMEEIEEALLDKFDVDDDDAEVTAMSKEIRDIDNRGKISLVPVEE